MRVGAAAKSGIEKNAREGKKGKPVSPIAVEAVRRLDALFEIERAINVRGADERRAVRQEKSKPLLDDMHVWLLRERETLLRSSEVLKPINYMLRRWDDFGRFLDDGRVCLTPNCAERALRGTALGRRNWTFAGSQRGADRATIMLTMITTCRLNEVDPKAWLADVLARIADLPTSCLHELLPWEWKLLRQARRRPPDLHAMLRHCRTRRAYAHPPIWRSSSYAYIAASVVHSTAVKDARSGHEIDWPIVAAAARRRPQDKLYSTLSRSSLSDLVAAHPI